MPRKENCHFSTFSPSICHKVRGQDAMSLVFWTLSWTLEWVAISFSRGSPNPGIKPGSPALQADSFTNWATREALYKYRASLLSTVSRRVGNDWETLTYSSAKIFLNFWVLGNLTKKGVNNILLLDFLTVVFEKKNRRTGSTHLATLAAAEKELAEKEA